MKVQLVMTALLMSTLNTACSQNLPDTVNAKTTNSSSLSASGGNTVSNATLPTDPSSSVAQTPAVTPFYDRNGTPIASGSAYYFKNLATGNCLDVTAASTSDGALIQPYACGAGATNQQWQMVQNADSSYSLISVASGKALDLNYFNIPKADNTFQIYTVSGNPNQSFTLSSFNGGYKLASLASSTQCIQDNGQHIFAETCGTVSNEAFVLIPAGETP